MPSFDARPDYYDYVSRGYDFIATTYDEVEGGNVVGRRLRDRIQRTLAATFTPGQRVLEIGCGTGIEALALARRGIEVVATDISPEMIAEVRRKAERDGMKNLVAYRLAAHELERLLDAYGTFGFDGAFSHGGVLNMDPNLAAVAEGVADLVRPHGPFVCTLVNQASLFETAFYTFVLKPRKAFRRLGNVVPIPITRHVSHRNYVIPARFYSPGEFARIFQPYFRLLRLAGLGILLPPWNLSDYVERLDAIARAATFLEDRLAGHWPFNHWGSVYIAEFERT